ncbi:MAG: hypothetical protein E7365_01385 [Clostridiales bacterium]|nr:hypothetical protein [Clostridiales bacterium]
MTFWLRLYKNNKLINDAVCDIDIKKSPKQILEDSLKDCCYQLDIPNPMIMKKHISDIKNYSLTRFLPDDFPESVDFERAEINIFDENKKK